MFLDLIRDRRSIRKFKSQKVEKEKVDALIEAALRSPSSKGTNSWHFIVVEDETLLKKLSEAKPHGSSFLAKAPLAVVVCGDTDKSDMWIENAAIASVFIHLAAHDTGLGSCWVQIRGREHNPFKSADTYVKELLEIPDNMMVEAIIGVGYSDETKQGHKKEKLHYNKVSFNAFETKG